MQPARLLSIASLIAVLMGAPVILALPSAAQNECQRNTGGNCAPGETAIPRSLKGGAVTHQSTQAPPKGNHKGREAYTPAQREEFMEYARKLCRKKYGAPSTVYRIDYKKNMVWCTPASY